MHDRTLTESGQNLPEKLKWMTGRGGGGRDRTRWSATTRPMQRPITELGEDLWELLDALVDAGTGRGLTPFFNPIFNATSPNQVPIQRDSNKHQLEPDMSDLTHTLKFFKVFCLRLVLFLRK
jgi:hypothetical protein